MDVWPGLIRRYRRQRGLTQMAFAALVGVEQATISRWERGGHRPDLAMQRRLRDLVGRPDCFSDRLILHRTRMSVWPVSLRRMSGELVASSPSASLIQARMQAGAGRDAAEEQHDSFNRHWSIARRERFFDADIASIRGAGTWQPADGSQVRYGGGIWTPVMMEDGEVLLSSQFYALSRDDFEALPLAQRFGIVTMDDLVG